MVGQLRARKEALGPLNPEGIGNAKEVAYPSYQVVQTRIGNDDGQHAV